MDDKIKQYLSDSRTLLLASCELDCSFLSKTKHHNKFRISQLDHSNIVCIRTEENISFATFILKYVVSTPTRNNLFIYIRKFIHPLDLNTYETGSHLQ